MGRGQLTSRIMTIVIGNADLYEASVDVYGSVYETR
jgi:hypothetical protein